MKFTNSEVQKTLATLYKRGYKNHKKQHNGILLAKVEDGILYKVVVTITGRAMRYLPTKATTRDKQLYN